MTEDKPHIVFPAGTSVGVVLLFPSYAEAHAHWLRVSDRLKSPHLIATVGRVIDPSTPVIDPNE